MTAKQTFDVAIYNRDVRDLVKEGRRHRDLSSAWADVHYIEIEAATEQEARVKVARRYPSSKGYVIDDIIRQKY